MKISIKFTILYLLVSAFIALAFVNSTLTFFSLVVILLSLKLVWRINEPPILPFIIIYHWLQISIKIFHANILKVPVANIAISNSTDKAIWLSLIGLLIFSFGFYLIIRKLRPTNFVELTRLAHTYSLSKLFSIFIFIFIAFIFLRGIMFLIPGLTQIIAGILNFKSVLIYFIFLISIIQKQYKILVWILIMETLLGLTGFFSYFKQPYFLLFLAYFTVNHKISWSAVKYIVPISFFFLMLVLIWTAIKTDYRKSINNFSGTMVVNVSITEQFDILVENVSRVNQEMLGNAVEAAVNRLSYVDFFGQVIDYVPLNKDYEYGKLWYGALTHVFKPRILFPDKEILDDSIRTTEYTGIYRPGLDKGASIGLGYYTESYIDFGVFFMFIPLFFLGTFYGFIFKYLINNSYNLILVYSIIVSILLLSYQFEIRNDKLIGGIVSNFIIIMVINRLFLNKLLAPRTNYFI
jgi:hypothetical protein